MRTRAAGTSLTVGELREALAGVPDDAEVLCDDIGIVVGVESGPFSVTFEGTEVTDWDSIAEDNAEFVDQVATGKLKTLKSIKVRAEELNG